MQVQFSLAHTQLKLWLPMRYDIMLWLSAWHGLGGFKFRINVNRGARVLTIWQTQFQRIWIVDGIMYNVMYVDKWSPCLSKCLPFLLPQKSEIYHWINVEKFFFSGTENHKTKLLTYFYSHSFRGAGCVRYNICNLYVYKK